MGSPRGVYQAPIDYSNSEFYGFSEFFYCTEDVLRMGGPYDSAKYSKAATVTTAHHSRTYHDQIF
jgi:Golgi nucleoside diphosphatase